MTSRDFCYWLQGALEVTNPNGLSAEQLQVIKAHLALVFQHEIDPSAGSSAHQEALNQTHATGTPGPKPNVTGKPTVFRC